MKRTKSECLCNKTN